MYFVEEDGAGDGHDLSVVEMQNVLSTSPTFSSSVMAVDPYTDAAGRDPARRNRFRR